jgi:ABC-2 type transport system permease protein
MNITVIFALVRNDIRLYFSDRRSVMVGVLVPILIAAFFGYIFGGTGRSEDQGKIPIAIVDEDHSAVSRGIAADLTADPLLQVSALDRAAAREQVKSGKQSAAAVFPQGFGEQTTKSLFSGADKPQVELLVDPSQNTSARVIEGLLAQYSMQEISKEAFSGAYGRKAIDSYLEKLDRMEQTPLSADLKTLLNAARKLNAQVDSTAAAAAAAAAAAGSGTGENTGEQGKFSLSIPYTVASTPVTAHDKTPYNSYAHSFAGMAVQFILFAGIDAGVLLLLTRQRGIWQRLRSAPLGRSEFMLARALATTMIGLFQIALIYLAAMLVFKVRIDGSWPGFIAVCISFCLLNATFGLMLATLGRSASSTRGLATMVTLLLVMLGGAWVPAFVFPRWLQDVSRYLPTRWAVDGLDGATWRGLPFDAAVLPTLILLGSAAICLLVAIWRFRWEE